MPYGVPDKLWRTLPPDDQAQVRAEWEAAQPAPIAPAPTRETQSATVPVELVSTPSAPNWFYVRRRGEFPGNHPDYDQLRAIGINGILTEADDPLLQDGLRMDRAAGFLVGVWYDPKDQPDAPSAVAFVKAAVGDAPVDAVAWDVEAKGKGYEGSEGWNFSAAMAQAGAQAFPNAQLIVTPPPLGIGEGGKSDYNYGAWVAQGGIVTVQTYGADLQRDLFDPVEVVQNVHKNGVPYAQIAVLISPAQLTTAPPALKALGVRSISVFTQDGLTQAVVAAAAPFSASQQVPATTTTQAPPVEDATTETTTTEVPAIAPDDTTVEEIDDAGSTAVPLDAADEIDWTVDVLAEGPDENPPGIRVLSSVGAASRHFPSYCPIAVGGYTQGVTGPVGAGIRQFELMIGVQNVIADYFTGAGVAHSWHHCGLACDMKPDPRFWRMLWPLRSQLPFLGGPSSFAGLYAYGKRYYDKKTQADHEDHICVYLNMTADAVSILIPRLPNGRKHVPGGAHPAPLPTAKPAPKTPVLEHAWESLSDALAESIPTSINRIAAARTQLHDALTTK